MSVREIPATAWQEFLAEFSRGHRAWLATIDSVAPGGPPHLEAVERPLRSVIPTMHAARVVGIEIRFEEDSEARGVVRIEAPLSVRVDETTEGTARGLEIVDEDGACTRVRFRSAPASEMLDGIAPGELPREP
jgi:hypothetical protein